MPDAEDADNQNSIYQVPALRSKKKDNSRTHSDRTGSASSTNAPSENYDYPPSYRDTNGGELPPEIPPRPVPHNAQAQYENLLTMPSQKNAITSTPSNIAGANVVAGINLNTVLPAAPKAHTVHTNIGYDVPRSSLLPSSTHYISPPPPVPHRPPCYRPSSGSGYLNDNTKIRSNSMGEENGTAKSGEDAVNRKNSDSSYSNQPSLPPSSLSLTTPILPPRVGSGGDGHPDSNRSNSPNSAIYHHPPPSSASSTSSSSSASVGVPPARPPARVPQRAQPATIHQDRGNFFLFT